jgi:dynein heavy chain
MNVVDGHLVWLVLHVQVRWQESVKVLDGKLTGLVGNTLVGAASVAYLGPLTLAYRKDLVAHWVAMCKHSQIPISQHFDLIHSMAEPNQVVIQIERRQKERAEKK